MMSSFLHVNFFKFLMSHVVPRFRLECKSSIIILLSGLWLLISPFNYYVTKFLFICCFAIKDMFPNSCLSWVLLWYVIHFFIIYFWLYIHLLFSSLVPGWYITVLRFSVVEYNDTNYFSHLTFPLNLVSSWFSFSFGSLHFQLRCSGRFSWLCC